MIIYLDALGLGDIACAGNGSGRALIMEALGIFVQAARNGHAISFTNNQYRLELVSSVTNARSDALKESAWMSQL
jgi:hypothetical protein